jgi:hypothetical protein
MGTKWIRGFIVSAGGILLAAALIRFLIAVGNAQCLSLPEPLLGIPLRYAVLLVGTIELTVALICLFGRQVVPQIGWLAWLATNFIVYRFALLCMQYHPQGTCIGSLTDPLYITRGATGYLMEFIPFCLVFGNLAAILWLWFSNENRTARRATALQHVDRQDAAAGLLKMPCPSCGGKIKFPTQNLGQKIPCPHCRASITLQAPGNLKMSCVLCGGHIEFPAYALGQKIPCPHCRATITLLNQFNT